MHAWVDISVVKATTLDDLVRKVLTASQYVLECGGRVGQPHSYMVKLRSECWCLYLASTECFQLKELSTSCGSSSWSFRTRFPRRLCRHAIPFRRLTTTASKAVRNKEGKANKVPTVADGLDERLQDGDRGRLSLKESLLSCQSEPKVMRSVDIPVSIQENADTEEVFGQPLRTVSMPILPVLQPRSDAIVDLKGTEPATGSLLFDRRCHEAACCVMGEVNTTPYCTEFFKPH